MPAITPHPPIGPGGAVVVSSGDSCNCCGALADCRLGNYCVLFSAVTIGANSYPAPQLFGLYHRTNPPYLTDPLICRGQTFVAGGANLYPIDGPWSSPPVRFTEDLCVNGCDPPDSFRGVSVAVAIGCHCVNDPGDPDCACNVEDDPTPYCLCDHESGYAIEPCVPCTPGPGPGPPFVVRLTVRVFDSCLPNDPGAAAAVDGVLVPGVGCDPSTGEGCSVRFPNVAVPHPTLGVVALAGGFASPAAGGPFGVPACINCRQRIPENVLYASVTSADYPCLDFNCDLVFGIIAGPGYEYAGWRVAGGACLGDVMCGGDDPEYSACCGDDFELLCDGLGADGFGNVIATGSSSIPAMVAAGTPGFTTLLASQVQVSLDPFAIVLKGFLSRDNRIQPFHDTPPCPDLPEGRICVPVTILVTA